MHEGPVSNSKGVYIKAKDYEHVTHVTFNQALGECGINVLMKQVLVSAFQPLYHIRFLKISTKICSRSIL